MTPDGWDRTDYHCHILPGIDDGAEDAAASVKIIALLHEQGVRRIVATPHFYAHRENSVKEYLEKRRLAWERLQEAAPTLPEIHLGAEVLIGQGIRRLKDIEKLRLGDTPYILLELPYAPFAHWMLEEVEAISYLYQLKPVMAHIHRYARFYRKKQISDVLQTDAVFQINNGAFRTMQERNFAWRIIKDGYPYLFGSDAHNLSDRRPDWDFLRKKVKPEIIGKARTLFPVSALSSARTEST